MYQSFTQYEQIPTVTLPFFCILVQLQEMSNDVAWVFSPGVTATGIDTAAGPSFEVVDTPVVVPPEVDLPGPSTGGRATTTPR